MWDRIKIEFLGNRQNVLLLCLTMHSTFFTKSDFFFFFNAAQLCQNKVVPKKVGLTNVFFFLNFGKNETELRIRFFGFAHV